MLASTATAAASYAVLAVLIAAPVAWFYRSPEARARNRVRNQRYKESRTVRPARWLLVASIALFLCSVFVLPASGWAFLLTLLSVLGLVSAVVVVLVGFCRTR